MYRKPSGKKGFSFWRMVTNTVPNIPNDVPEQDADLTSLEKDLLWLHQINGAAAVDRLPIALDEVSYLKAGITGSVKVSRQIHHALLKNGVVSLAYPNGIDTMKITPKFANQLYFISVHAQRKCVGMLFFWEEEVVRWRLLDDEEQEIQNVIDNREGTSIPEDLRIALERVRMQKAMMPSYRGRNCDGGIGAPTDGEAALLPTYMP